MSEQTSVAVVIVKRLGSSKAQKPRKPLFTGILEIVKLLE